MSGLVERISDIISFGNLDDEADEDVARTAIDAVFDFLSEPDEKILRREVGMFNLVDASGCGAEDDIREARSFFKAMLTQLRKEALGVGNERAGDWQRSY